MMRNILSQAAQRLGVLPLMLMGTKLRAKALEPVLEEMLTVSRVPGNEIVFYTPSPLLISRARSLLSKEVDTIQWIEAFEEETVFWDIGANIGVYSLYAATRKKIAVLAFEPSAANYLALSRNVQLNNLSDRINAYCVALAGHTALGVLNMSSPLMGAAVNQFGGVGEMSPYWEGETAPTHQGMIGFSIDDFILKFCPPFPNYIKLDVDGLEVPILEGAKNTLRDLRLQSIIAEVSVSNEVEHERSLEILFDAGFELVSRGPIQGTATGQAANHLFKRTS